ncbi:MAG: PDZ domain-containing protein [Chloroflexi bacterium]|nr:PDZ domain-containing protein [Chloroflexota bacterium]
MAHALSFSQTVQAPPELVYRHFANASLLEYWLAERAYVHAEVGGVIFLNWDTDNYYAAGSYTTLSPGQAIAFSWYGSGEPAPSQVEVAFEAVDGGTLVKLTHSKLGEGDEWATTLEGLKSNWVTYLENLKSILEEGKALRLYNRPLMGVFPSEFVTAAMAQEEGLPYSSGAKISGVLPDTGAEAAGLQGGDVINMINAIEITDWGAIGRAVEGKLPGDEVALVFHRGTERHEVSLALSQRPFPDVPDSFDGMAAKLQTEQADFIAELEAFLAEISAEEAAQQPAEKAWSVNQNLAHLILNERATQQYIHNEEQDVAGSTYIANDAYMIDALIDVLGDSKELLAEFKRATSQTAAMVRRFPEALVKRRGPYIYIGQILQGLVGHNQQHLAQMKDVIAALRGEAAVEA